MELAAIIIAAMAFVVSITSVYYAKRSNDETRELRTIESQRRHDERCPKLNVHVEEMNQGQWHRLWVVLESHEKLNTLHAEILDNPDVCFSDGQRNVDPEYRRSLTASWGALSIGAKEAAWRVSIGPTAPDQMRVRFTCTIADQSWQIVCSVTLPSTDDISKSVW